MPIVESAAESLQVVMQHMMNAMLADQVLTSVTVRSNEEQAPDSTMEPETLH